MKEAKLFFPFLILVLCFWNYNLFADTGEIKIPWQEFKKLADLDNDNIVLPLETFKKILSQTGSKHISNYNLVKGNVILTSNEFKNLVNKMKSPAENLAAPFDYLITKAIYKGEMKKENTFYKATFTVHVLADNKYLNIPVLPNSLALEDISINGKKALIVSRSGYHNVVFKDKGEYRVECTFSQKSSLTKGPHNLTLNIISTPITIYELIFPLAKIDAEITEAQQISSIEKDGKTVVKAILAQTSRVSVSWRKKYEVTEKLPPKIYSEINNLISIEDDALKVKSAITYNILHSEINEVGLNIPENCNILNVYGEGVGEWQEILKEDNRIIHVPLTYGKKGYITINVVTEIPFSEGLETIYSGVRTLNTVRENGWLGIELNTSAEVVITDSKGLEKIAIQRLPKQLINTSAKPMIKGFKYAKHPFELTLKIKKHKKIGVPIAAVNNANMVTLFTEDGKIVNRLIYNIKNSSKQFLQISLPEKADVWSVFVDDKPVESSLNEEGKLLVPLIRSVKQNNRLKVFPLEVIFSTSQDPFSVWGFQQADLPSVDLLTSQLLWSVYLPYDYKYLYFDSTLEKEELIRGLNIFSDTRVYDESSILKSGRKGIDKDQRMEEVYSKKNMISKFRNAPVKKKEQIAQIQEEMEFGGKMDDLAQSAPKAYNSGEVTETGLMPIHIKLPTSGQVYRFAKTIIKPGDPLNFKVNFVSFTIIKLLKWGVFFIALLLVYLARKRIKSIYQRIELITEKITKKIAVYLRSLHKIFSSVMLPFILVGFIIVSFIMESLFFFVVFFLLLWINLVVLVFLYFSRKKQKVRVKKESVTEESDNSFEESQF